MWLYLATLFVLYFFLRWYWEKGTIPNLTDKHVLITGCDSGFGNLLARHLDQRGLWVLAVCMTQNGAELLTQATSLRLQTVILDVTNTDSVVAMAHWVKQRVGDKGLWGLVNNAGIGYPSAPNEWLTKQDFTKVINVNLLGLIDVTLNLLPLVRQARGRIVNVSSGSGRIALQGGGYCPSKYGVEAFSDSLRRELQPFGVKVSIIEPGCFDTGIATPQKVDQGMQALWERVPKEVKESYGEQYFKTREFNRMVKIVSVVRPLRIVPSEYWHSYLNDCKNFKKLATTGNSNLHLVTDSMQHALTAVYPRTRYSPGWDMKFIYLPFSYFPTIVQDYWFTRSAPKPGQ